MKKNNFTAPLLEEGPTIKAIDILRYKSNFVENSSTIISENNPVLRDIIEKYGEKVVVKTVRLTKDGKECFKNQVGEEIYNLCLYDNRYNKEYLLSFIKEHLNLKGVEIVDAFFTNMYLISETSKCKFKYIPLEFRAFLYCVKEK